MSVAAVRLVATTALVLAIALPASSQHCSWYSTSAHEAQLGAYYLDVDVCQPSCLYSAWVYQESNGLAGLQRGDSMRDDTCHGLIERDTIVL